MARQKKPVIKSDIDVPRDFFLLAQRRTRPLLQYGINMDKPVQTVAASCYLQGFIDAAEALRDE